MSETSEVIKKKPHFQEIQEDLEERVAHLVDLRDRLINRRDSLSLAIEKIAGGVEDFAVRKAPKEIMEEAPAGTPINVVGWIHYHTHCINEVSTEIEMVVQDISTLTHILEESTG